MKAINYITGLGLVVSLGGCVDAYMPDVVDTPNSLLVVDGFINGNGRTRIKLSRSINVGTTTAPPPVRAAVVNIVDDQGRRYLARESSSVFGLYVSDSLQLSGSRQYKLSIVVGTTSTAPQYESAMVPMKVTPDFDQLELVREDGQVRLLASTHDATGQTRFYRWRTYETWEFNPPYKSELEVIGGFVRARVTPIYTCYRSETPSLVRQTSTLALSADQVTRQNIQSFSDRAERVKVRYSVLVTQAAETAEEFAYYEILRKNTEAVGTVNDPLPSQLTGNVRRVNGPAEVVLGFVSAHTLTQRRLFTTPASLGLPPRWQFDDPYADCSEGFELVPDPDDKHPIYRPDTRIFKSGDNIPTTYYIVGRDTMGYNGARGFCVDCRQRGSIVKPSYW